MNIISLVAAMFRPGGGDARPKVQTVSPRTAHEQAGFGSVLIIDVRTPDEWAQTGIAPGAARITLQDQDFLDKLARAAGGNKDAALAFICRSGMRSGAAAGKARAAGYTNVYNVTGGMSMAGGWIDAGLPVDRQA
ncbi:rhodanese-like domain-containing protein [Hyphomonas sp.]|uniref:rhodanese-like domain-containing protein n=1 Tax=Hyphomonas sp. TaxID=87 RepID=UPI00391A28D6